MTEAATTFLGVCDPHLTDRKPGSRRDPSFKETQERKLRFVFSTAQEYRAKGHHVVLCIAGDWFHQPDGGRISRRLDTWLSPLFRESGVTILGIAGNHDMKSHRHQSLDAHPYGVLRANQVFTEVSWPTYVVVGTDPKVIVTGLTFSSKGASPWLKELREGGALKKLKADLGVKHCYAMTHCWWGRTSGLSHGEPRAAYSEIRGTGIDMMIYGHPHSDDGEHQIYENPEEEKGKFSVVSGPGSLFRGSLAEVDLKREPKISVATFLPNEESPISQNLVVPHEPVSIVFDVAKHKREKEHDESKSKLVEEMQAVSVSSMEWQKVMGSIVEQKNISPEVVDKSNQFLERVQ